MVQILAANFWNRILLGSPFGSDSAARQRNLSIKAEPNRALVVNQVMKEWDVRSPAMTGYCNAVRKLEKRFEGLELHHIPRLKNQAADELAKIGSKREAIPRNVFLEHIHSPSV